MANFKVICNQVNTIVGLQGQIIDTESTMGVQKNIVEAVRSTWIDIQTQREDWTFMQGSVTNFSTVASQSTYTPTEVFGSASQALELGTYKEKRGIWLDQWPLLYVNWEDLPFIDNTTEKEPRWYTIDPNNNLIFQLPDDAYLLDIRYNRAVQSLVANGDVPYLNANYHNAIAYKAAQKVAVYVGQSGLYQEYSQEGNRILGQMMRKYIVERRVYPAGFII